MQGAKSLGSQEFSNRISKKQARNNPAIYIKPKPTTPLVRQESKERKLILELNDLEYMCQQALINNEPQEDVNYLIQETHTKLKEYQHNISVEGAEKLAERLINFIAHNHVRNKEGEIMPLEKITSTLTMKFYDCKSCDPNDAEKMGESIYQFSVYLGDHAFVFPPLQRKLYYRHLEDLYIQFLGLRTEDSINDLMKKDPFNLHHH